MLVRGVGGGEERGEVYYCWWAVLPARYKQPLPLVMGLRLAVWGWAGWVGEAGYVVILFLLVWEMAMAAEARLMLRRWGWIPVRSAIRADTERRSRLCSGRGGDVRLSERASLRGERAIALLMKGVGLVREGEGKEAIRRSLTADAGNL